MKHYEKYQCVDQRWVKSIPSHWEFFRLKRIFAQRVEKDDPIITENILSLTAKQGVVPYAEKEGSGGNKPKGDMTQYNIARPNDLLVNCMNIVAGSAGVSRYFGAISPVYYALYPRLDCNVWYYHYLFRLMPFQRSLIGLGKGILMHESESGALNTVRMRISMDYLGNVNLPIPPRDEQDQIVRYLDWQVSKINRLISAKRKQIELLKEHKEAFINTAVTRGIVGDIPLKESGLQWLPKIPAHWKPVPAKALFRNISELRHEDDPMLAATQKYGLIEQAEYMRRENRRIVLANDNLDKWLHVEPNDFIISLRSFQGGLEKCDKPGCVTWHYVVLRPQQHVYPPFYKWFFKSASYIGALQKTSDFIRDGQDLRFSNFVKVGLFVIPMAEQVKIADRLDSEIPKYQKAIDTLEKEIQQIIEYRTRLISDVVTGQIDVRGVKVSDFIYTEDTDSKQMDEAEEYMGVK